MGVLSGLQPERVFYYFEEICKIPHGSYDVKAISDYLMGVAASLHLEARQDEEYNVVIKKPAAPGYEKAPALMIQGHMDMVCVKNPDVVHDFKKDGLKLAIEDGWVHACGTTLGADDGVALAMGLAILEDDSLIHPALEVVFTTEEEVGMEGAIALDTSDLKAAYLLNLDSEAEGHFLAGCAGGVKVHSLLPVKTAEAEGVKMTLGISGLAGGHSGAEIDKGRGNANILLGRLLYELDKQAMYHVISVEGGEKDNAIPSDSRAVIVAAPEDADLIRETALAFGRTLANEFHTSDPGVRVEAVCGEAGSYEVMTTSSKGKMVFMLMEVPNGIQTMSADLPGLPESSLNLGVLRTDEEGVHMTWAVRSSVKSLKTLMSDKLQYMTELLGGEVTFSGDYPEWPFNPGSEICELCLEVYEEQTGKKGVVETIHAGVECGLLAEKMPGLDMVSMGPELLEIHTPRERMNIASMASTYALVLEVIKRLAERKA